MIKALGAWLAMHGDALLLGAAGGGLLMAALTLTERCAP